MPRRSAMAPQTSDPDERRGRSRHAGDADGREPEIQPVDLDERHEGHGRGHAAAEQGVGKGELTHTWMVEDQRMARFTENGSTAPRSGWRSAMWRARGRRR